MGPGRRDSRDAPRAEEGSMRQANRAGAADSTKAESAAAAPTEDGWSTVSAKKGRGGSKAALAS